MFDSIEIIAILLTFLITSVGLAKLLAGKFGALSKELGELFTAVSIALEDSKITGDEIRQIIKEAKDIPGAVMSLRNRAPGNRGELH